MSEVKYVTVGKIVSSFEKVTLLKEPAAEEYFSRMLVNERLNFQLVFKSDRPYATKKNRIEVRGDLASYVTLRTVENVPVSYTAPEADDYYTGKEPGLYPDLLKPIGALGIVLPCRQWKSVWVSLEKKEGLPIGRHELTFSLFDEGGTTLSELRYTAEVIGASSPKNQLKLTNWIHYDCISRAGKTRPFTKKFYSVFEKYLSAYTDCGFNMLLTPIFTPPLDTERGSERMTAQLVDVTVENGKYRFDFSKLEEFVRFARAHGIEYFEFSHLFTQWGGKFCPKIVAKENGKTKKIFGWHVASDSPEYVAFLNAFLPELCKRIEKLGIENVSYLHLTDEPAENVADQYEKCYNVVKKNVGDLPVMDALSSPVFYERGIVDTPVSITDCFERFKDLNCKDLIVYYCCFPNAGYYSNRFINMTGVRTRILGAQLYATGATGFLHWGFNFYNSVLSIEPIDPYAVTDGCGFYPGGDGYIVYPAANGVNYSIRAELTKEAFQDYNALKLLEELAGKELTARLIKEAGIKNYNEYPRGNDEFAAFRNRIYEELEKAVKKR